MKVLVGRYTVPAALVEKTFNFTFEAGKVYTLRAEFPVPDVDDNGHAFPWPNKSHVWIACDGVAVTPKQVVLLQGPDLPPGAVVQPIVPILIFTH